MKLPFAGKLTSLLVPELWGSARPDSPQSFTSSRKENAAIQVVAEQTARRVPMFATTGCGSARATLELSRYAQSVGADGLMVVAPKWVALGASEQSVFFEEVCRNVDLPVMLQDADFAGAGLPALMIVA